MKKSTSAVLLFVVLLVFSVCLLYTDVAPVAVEDVNSPSPTFLANDVQSPIEPSSAAPVHLTFDRYTTRKYLSSGFDSEFYIFRFAETDVVVYNYRNTYIVGDDAGEKGACYAHIVCNDHFLGLSDKYLLFLNEDGKVAVSFEEQIKSDACNIIRFNPCIPYDELSKQEQEQFVYPISCEKVVQEENAIN